MNYGGVKGELAVEGAAKVSDSLVLSYATERESVGMTLLNKAAAFLRKVAILQRTSQSDGYQEVLEMRREEKKKSKSQRAYGAEKRNNKKKTIKTIIDRQKIHDFFEK